MSVDLQLDAKTHDLALDLRGRARLVAGAARVAQQVEVTLLTFLGEWFLDITFGVPYFETILVKSPNRTEIESVIRARVKAVPGVRAVPTVEIEMEASTRRARITLPDLEAEEGIVRVSVLQ